MKKPTPAPGPAIPVNRRVRNYPRKPTPTARRNTTRVAPMDETEAEAAAMRCPQCGYPWKG